MSQPTAAAAKADRDAIGYDVIDAVRAFNRFYTQRIGALDEHLYGAGFTLSEARVLYELHAAEASAADLARALGLDPAYLSRILKGFREKGWVASTRCAEDARRTRLSLTDAGRAAYAPLLQRSREAVRMMLASAPEARRAALLSAMRTIRACLDDAHDARDAQAAAPPPVLLRPLRAADLGWVIDRHGALYAEEHGFNDAFTGLVAVIAGGFLRTSKPGRSEAWIAERAGRTVGSVFVADTGEGVAQLRLLLVEPDQRGAGVGRALLDAAIGFARAAGYKELRLWTNDVLHAARRLYERAGFTLIDETPHEMFGPKMIGQTLSLRLT
ncbi:MAG: bifunctional helix-turn-helix transcriptional regulator/GNAT family N-acetyltransferase [Pseudomonadota bacterium]